MKGNSKEEIKNRMINYASTLWGVSANEIEISFDPVISMLIASCASEIEKISNEVDQSQIRVTEKLIQLMTPETIYGPKPANAILHTEPIEENTVLKPEYLFYYKKKETYKKTSVKFKNIYFSPIQQFKLIPASVKYITTGNCFVEFETQKSRKVIFENNSSSAMPSSTLYLGISSSLPFFSLENISFYFELLGTENKELFYHHLKNSAWKIEESNLEVTAGLQDEDELRQKKLISIFEEISSKTNNICQQTRNFYKKHYITVKTITNHKNATSSNFPELRNFIQENKIKLEDGIRWIRIDFSSVITNTLLKNVYCSLNSFPVLNRELNSFTYRINEFINILPIKTEDLFLDMKSIVNTNGEFYKLGSKQNAGQEKGTFTLRRDNIGKLDHRNAKEYITLLIELLKDESASFSLFNNDFLQSNLKDLNQLISLLEKKVSETNIDDTETVYALLKPFKKKENLLVEFWTTNGSSANNIKTGSSLEIYRAIGLKQKSSYLVTPTLGGKDDLNMKDRLNAYRRTLLSRDKVVTKEDIKALCYEFYSDKIKKVEIKKGFMSDNSLRKGLIQCVEIHLYPAPNDMTETAEWEFIHNNLLFYLKKNSLNIFPYKIKIVN